MGPLSGVARLAELVKHRDVVAADTMVFIYHFEDHNLYAPLTQWLFETWEAGEVRGVTSVITLLEILVKPLREGFPEAASDYFRLLTTFPHLTIAPVDEATALEAARLRARYHLATPDAIQVATALRHGARLFVTNDRSLGRLGDQLEVVLLEDLVQAQEVGEDGQDPGAGAAGSSEH